MEVVRGTVRGFEREVGLGRRGVFFCGFVSERKTLLLGIEGGSRVPRLVSE